MEKLTNRLRRMMYGRYGIDTLNKFAFGFTIVLLFTNIFLQSILLNILIWIILIVTTFRTYSKNISKRRFENTVFLKLTTPIRKNLALTVRRIKEIKTARFRKCPNCNQTMRLQPKKGKHNVVCPKCKKTVSVNIRF